MSGMEMCTFFFFLGGYSNVLLKIFVENSTYNYNLYPSGTRSTRICVQIKNSCGIKCHFKNNIISTTHVHRNKI